MAIHSCSLAAVAAQSIGPTRPIVIAPLPLTSHSMFFHCSFMSPTRGAVEFGDGSLNTSGVESTVPDFTTVRMSELLVRATLSDFDKAESQEELDDFPRLERWDLGQRSADLEQRSPHELAFQNGLSVFEKHLDGFTEIGIQLVKRVALAVRTGEAGNVANEDPRVRAALDDSREGPHAAKNTPLLQTPAAISDRSEGLLDRAILDWKASHANAETRPTPMLSALRAVHLTLQVLGHPTPNSSPRGAHASAERGGVNSSIRASDSLCSR